MNNIDMLSSLTLPTFVAHKEVKAEQLNTVVRVFRSAIEILRDRVDYIRQYDDGSNYAEEGDISDEDQATYKMLSFLRDLNNSLTSLSSSFTAYTLSNNARIGNWATIYSPAITNIVQALNNLYTLSSNNASNIITINNLLDGVTVGAIEDLKSDIDTIQHSYATDLDLAQAIAGLAGVGRTTQTIKGNADAITNLNIDIQSKADLVNGTVPMSQLPSGIRNSNKGRYATLSALNTAWPAGSADLQAGDFAVVGTGTKSEFFSFDAVDGRWESSGYSGTVNKVNNVDPDGNGNVTLSTTNISEGNNKYFTEERVNSTPAIIAALTKLTGIASGATVGANWNTNLSNIPTDLVHDADLDAYALISSLATVATTGNYEDLNGAPSVPTKVSDLENDSMFVGAGTTALTHYYQSGDIDSYLALKVDKVPGKGLSTEDYSNAEKTKLGGIEAGAQVNDANTTTQGNTFNGANQLLKLDSLGRLPALDGRNLTNLSTAGLIPLTTLGDLLVHTGSALARLASGATGQLLSVDPNEPTGLKWIDNPYNTTPTTLLGLLDTPDSYENKAGNILRVKENESEIEFVELQDAITGTFTNASLTAGILTINHTYGSAIMPYVIVDESNNVMIPNEINFGDGIITITLTDFTPIIGTWKYAFGTRSISDPDAFDRTININGVASDPAGNITLNAEDIGALPDNTLIPTKTSDILNDRGFIINTVDNLINYTLSSALHAVALSGSYSDLDNKPSIPTSLADLIADSTHRLVTDTEKSTWNGKQDAISIPQYSIPYKDTSGTGSPNTNLGVSQNSANGNTIARRTAAGAIFTATATDDGHAVNRVQMDTALALKQTSLVSGTNIKTINGVSLLGSGDLELEFISPYYGTMDASYTPTADTDVITKAYLEANASGGSTALQISYDSIYSMSVYTHDETTVQGAIDRLDEAVETTVKKASGSPTTVNDIWMGTQAQYDAIGSKVATRLYFITA